MRTAARCRSLLATLSILLMSFKDSLWKTSTRSCTKETSMQQKLKRPNLARRRITRKVFHSVARTHCVSHFALTAVEVNAHHACTILSLTKSSGRDINLEILRVEGYRKFCNKIFNATKFAMLKLDESFIPELTPEVRTAPKTVCVF